MYMDNLALIWKILDNQNPVSGFWLSSIFILYPFVMIFMIFLQRGRVIPLGFIVVVLFICLYWSRTNNSQLWVLLLLFCLFACIGRGPIIAKNQLSPTCTLLASARECFLHFLQTTIMNLWWQSTQQSPTFVSCLIQKKSDKTPLETMPLYINLAGGDVNEAETPVAIINRKSIANWCSNDCKILVTPSFFVVRLVLLISFLMRSSFFCSNFQNVRKITSFRAQFYQFCR